MSYVYLMPASFSTSVDLSGNTLHGKFYKDVYCSVTITFNNNTNHYNNNNVNDNGMMIITITIIILTIITII